MLCRQIEHQILNINFKLMLKFTCFKGVVTCAKKTKKTVKVRNGESYTFKTNADGSQYGANTKCSVSYKKMRGCKNLKISCDQFSLGAGDFLRVGKGKKNT